MTAFKPLDERHFKHIEKQIENIRESKMYIDPTHLKTIEIYDNQLKICRLEKLILTTFNSDNKNILILSKLKERYTDLLRDALEMYEDAVNIGELTEGEYINYAKQLREGDKALGKICEIGMRFCKN